MSGNMITADIHKGALRHLVQSKGGLEALEHHVACCIVQ